MRNLIKPISAMLSALVLVTGLTACAKTPTPDEIYKKVEDAKSAKITIKMEFGEEKSDTTVMSTKITMEMEGDKAHIVTKTSIMGMENEEETYQEKKGDKLIVYTEDDDEWTKEETDNEEDEAGLEEFKELFDMDNYEEFDKESRRYKMKDDVTLDIEEMVCSDGYIEVGEDGTYIIYVELKQDLMGATLKGSMKITISELGKVSVKLPKVD
jgi:hypothetical protein